MLSRKNLIFVLIVGLLTLGIVSPIFSHDRKPDKPDTPGQPVDQGQGNGGNNGNAGGNGNGNGNGGGNGGGHGNGGGNNQDIVVTTPAPDTADANLLGCQKNNPGRLDCSSLEVSGVCEGNVAVFTIRNTGESGNGDMLASTQYRLIVDGVVVESGTVQLAGGARMTVQYSGGGSVTLEADQQVEHPGNSHPRTTLSCGTVVVTQSPTPEPTDEPTPTEEVTPTDEPTPTEEATPPTDEPLLTAVAYCLDEDGSIAFVITNSGGSMTDSVYFIVTDFDGNRVEDGWVQLNTNENLRLQYWGYTVLTLTVGEIQVTAGTECAPSATKEPTPLP